MSDRRDWYEDADLAGGMTDPDGIGVTGGSRMTNRSLIIDHPRFLAEPGYRRRVLRALLRAHKRGAGGVRVRQHHDEFCCTREPWALTAGRIREWLAARGVVAIVGPERRALPAVTPPKKQWQRWLQDETKIAGESFTEWLDRQSGSE